ncbi:hypothetical protein PMAG_a1280 [Pseudoalteromonas mariniglutinosa NCIMB 1770]|nr:hypothetical protein [Pseudoalteromonas mariniglutinosa NCIMB 1770]
MMYLSLKRAVNIKGVKYFKKFNCAAKWRYQQGGIYSD